MLLSIVLESSVNADKSKLLIDYQDDSIGFTVLSGEQQFDFSVDKKGWQMLKVFIDAQIDQEDKP